MGGSYHLVKSCTLGNCIFIHLLYKHLSPFYMLGTVLGSGVME